MICFDFETRSKADIKETGAWVYSTHPSTEILCLAYRSDEMTSPKLLVSGFEKDPIARNFFDIAIKRGQLFESHNAFFEKSIWQNILVKRYGWPQIPDHLWRCSASVAAYHGLPRNLQTVGVILNLPVKKDNDGHTVMLQLSKPNRTGNFYTLDDSPDKFQKLYEYCLTDVQAEIEVSKKLGYLPERELAIWQLDQKINRRGVPIDVKAVEAAIKILEQYTTKLTAEAVALSDGSFNTVNQRVKVIEWCKSLGESVEAYDKSYLAEYLNKVKNPKVKRVLEIRQQIGRTSTAKYIAMKNSVSEDGRIRDVLFYHGAITGRWSGKLVQFQNLPRGSIKDMESAIRVVKLADYSTIQMLHGNPMEFMSSAIRGMVKAPEGRKLVVADFAAIEARVLGWAAGSTKMLNQFIKGEDLYVEMASKIYGLPIAEIKSEHRQLGKAAILGAGYGMGATKFYQTCQSWGIKVSEQLASTAVNAYRQTYFEVPKFWSATEQAAHNAVRTRKPMVVGKTIWFMKDRFLVCQLPSGRHMHYLDPKFANNSYGNFELQYSGEANGTCVRVGTYGGKLVENVVQAIARDIMAEAMLRVEEAGYDVILSIHDEIIAEFSPKIKNMSDEDIVKDFRTLMAKSPEWAKGCPISASGWVGLRYKK